jgi:putative aldouronate transport system permease protein
MEILSVPLKKYKKRTSNGIQLMLFALVGMILLVVFSYLPMVGVLLSVKDGDKSLNILRILTDNNVAWTFKNYIDLLQDPKFWAVMKNTVGLNTLSLLVNFPAPIIFALLLHEVRNTKFRRTIQTIATFPHFISWVIFGGIINALTDMSTGVVNPLLNLFGIGSATNPIDLGLSQYFWTKMIITSLIKNVGWGSIIYYAAIVGIDPSLYEAAKMDGANRFQCAIHITLPMIAPTITTFLLLSISRILGNSFEQFYVFQNVANLDASEVLATYVYSTAFTYRNYSTAAAISFFEGIISVILLTISNKISKKVSGNSILG